MAFFDDLRQRLKTQGIRGLLDPRSVASAKKLYQSVGSGLSRVLGATQKQQAQKQNTLQQIRDRRQALLQRQAKPEVKKAQAKQVKEFFTGKYGAKTLADKIYESSQELYVPALKEMQARKTTDPIKKQQLLQEARESKKRFAQGGVEIGLALFTPSGGKFKMTEDYARTILKIGNKPITEQVVQNAWKKQFSKAYKAAETATKGATPAKEVQIISDARDFLKKTIKPVPPAQLTAPKVQPTPEAKPGLQPTAQIQPPEAPTTAPAQPLAVTPQKPIQPPKPAPGDTTKYKRPADLTTKILDDLQGKSVVSKQYILDATNRPELKQAERDLFRRLVEDEGDRIDVTKFSAKAKTELLPLKTYTNDPSGIRRGEMFSPKYENTTLPSEIRGRVANYHERLYSSPIRTSASSIHFDEASEFLNNNNEGYFAHSRIEDLPKATGTRRIIELQSDLFQKGRLETEVSFEGKPEQFRSLKALYNLLPEGVSPSTAYNSLKMARPDLMSKLGIQNIDEFKQLVEQANRTIKESPELAKLETYRNTWQDRIIREEVRRAAQDGIKKLQFPTGETAMKIEGLGDMSAWYSDVTHDTLLPEELEVGLTLTRGGVETFGEGWVITDILGDGKFKAVTKARWDEFGGDMTNFELTRAKEEFDISGKVDTSNPIYRFYEKEVGRYLVNKYQAKQITDPQGVTWWEVNILPKHRGAVDAFKRSDITTTPYDRSLGEISDTIEKIFGKNINITTSTDLTDPKGRGVLGMAFDRGIILLERNGSLSEAVANHEAFHYFKDNLATPEEVKYLNDIAVSLARKSPIEVSRLRKTGYKMSDIYDELLADEFARYYRTGKTFVEKLKILFDKIKQRLEALFNAKSDLLKFYRNIKKRGMAKPSGLQTRPAYKLEELPDDIPGVTPQELGTAELRSVTEQRRGLAEIRKGAVQQTLEQKAAQSYAKSQELEGMKATIAPTGNERLDGLYADFKRIVTTDKQMAGDIDTLMRSRIGSKPRQLAIKIEEAVNSDPQLQTQFNGNSSELYDYLRDRRNREREIKPAIKELKPEVQEAEKELRQLGYGEERLKPDAVEKIEAELKQSDEEFNKLLNAEDELTRRRAELAAQPEDAKFYLSRKYSSADTKNEETLLSQVPFYYMGSKRAMLGYTLDALGIQQRDISRIRLWHKTHLTDIRNVVDPFGGSGMTTNISKTLFPSARHTLGDLDPNMVSMWEQIDKRPKDVADFLVKLRTNEKVQRGFLPKSRLEDILPATETEDLAYKTAVKLYDLARPRSGGLVPDSKVNQIIEGIYSQSKMLKEITYKRLDAMQVMDEYIANGKETDLLWLDPPYLLSTGYSEGALFESPQGYLKLLDKYTQLANKGVRFISYNAEPKFVIDAEIAKITSGAGRYGKMSADQRAAAIKELQIAADEIELKLAEMANSGMTVMRWLRPKGGARGRFESMVVNTPWVGGLKLQQEVEGLAKEIFAKGYITGAWKPSEVVYATRNYLLEHPQSIIPPEKLQELAKLEGKELSELTADELRLVFNNMQHLVKLNELEGKIKVGTEYRDAKSIVEEARAELTTGRKVADQPDNLIDTSLRSKAVPVRERFMTLLHLKPEMLTNLLGGKENSLIQRIFYQSVDEGRTAELVHKQQSQDFLRRAIGDIDISKWSERFTKNPDYQIIKLRPTKNIKMTKEMRMSIYLSSKNQRSMFHMTNPDGGISFESDKYTVHRLTPAEIQTIIDSMTSEEKKIADAVSYLFNFIQKVKLNNVSKNLNGFEIAREPNYYPSHVNPITIKRDPNKWQTFYQNTLEGMGMLKPKTDAAQPLIIHGLFGEVANSIDGAARYIGMAEPLRQMKVLLLDQKFQQDVVRIWGKEYLHELKTYVKAIEGEEFATGVGDELIQGVFRSSARAILSAPSLVPITQLASVPLYSVFLPEKYMLAGWKMPVNLREIAKWSPQLRDRIYGGNELRGLGLAGRSESLYHFYTGKKAIVDQGTIGISATDNLTIGKLWEGIKLELKATRPDLVGDAFYKTAAKKLELVVRWTQSTFDIKERSPLARNNRNPLIKGATLFSSQTNNIYNLIYKQGVDYGRSAKTPKDRSRFFGNLFRIIVVGNLIVAGKNAIQDWVYNRKPLSPLQHVVRFFGTVLSPIYFAGDLWNDAVGAWANGSTKAYDSGNLVLDIINKTSQGIFDAIKALDQMATQEVYESGNKKGQSKWLVSAKSAISEALSVASKIMGLPYDQIVRLWGGVESRFTSTSAPTGYTKPSEQKGDTYIKPKTGSSVYKKPNS